MAELVNLHDSNVTRPTELGFPDELTVLFTILAGPRLSARPDHLAAINVCAQHIRDRRDRSDSRRRVRNANGVPSTHSKNVSTVL